MQLKILSWNIWIDGYFDQITDFLKTSNADIIGLQEVKADDPTRDVIKYLGDLGYKHAFAPVKKVWGNEIWNDGPAIFSTYEIRKTETYVLSEENSRVAIRADIPVGDKILNVFSTHLVHTHQEQSEIQEKQVASLIKTLPSSRTIVMGDFNATPDSAVIENMRNIFIDSDPSSAPTWGVYPEGCVKCNPQDISIRLDYIFTSKDIKTISLKVENSRGSDHLPISAVIEI